MDQNRYRDELGSAKPYTDDEVEECLVRMASWSALPLIFLSENDDTARAASDIPRLIATVRAKNEALSKKEREAAVLRSSLRSIVDGLRDLPASNQPGGRSLDHTAALIAGSNALMDADNAAGAKLEYDLAYAGRIAWRAWGYLLEHTLCPLCEAGGGSEGVKHVRGCPFDGLDDELSRFDTTWEWEHAERRWGSIEVGDYDRQACARSGEALDRLVAVAAGGGRLRPYSSDLGAAMNVLSTRCNPDRRGTVQDVVPYEGGFTATIGDDIWVRAHSPEAAACHALLLDLGIDVRDPEYGQQPVAPEPAGEAS
jgi:hypothetical protein